MMKLQSRFIVPSLGFLFGGVYMMFYINDCIQLQRMRERVQNEAFGIMGAELILCEKDCKQGEMIRVRGTSMVFPDAPISFRPFGYQRYGVKYWSSRRVGKVVTAKMRLESGCCYEGHLLLKEELNTESMELRGMCREGESAPSLGRDVGELSSEEN